MIASKESSRRVVARWAILGFFGLSGTVGVACIGDHPKACTESSECQPGGICDGQGFCTHECRQDADCPCGSSCNRSCGICLRNDTGGLATCFAIERNVSVKEALGACRAQDVPLLSRDASVDAEASGDLDGGACLPEPAVMMCDLDAGTMMEPGADAAPPPDGGTAPDVTADASADVSSDDDASSDTEGP
jgi:hypothetical protein